MSNVIYRPEEEALRKLLQNLRFLVVDSNSFSRGLVRTTLLQLGATRIEEETSTVTALTKLRAEDFDVLLLDQDMPGLTGLELVRLIRTKAEPTKKPDIPIVIITGNAQEYAIKEAKLSGVTEYLLKPFSSATLGKKLEHALLPPAPAKSLFEQLNAGL